MAHRSYYTLLVRENGIWTRQFGDYDREVVEQERLDVLDGWDAPLKRDVRVFKTSRDTEAYIAEAVALLNAKP